MLRRLASLQRRFLNANLRLHAGQVPILDGAGGEIGRVTGMTWKSGRVTVEGVATSGISLRLGSLSTAAGPQATPGKAFSLSLPWPGDLPPGSAAMSLEPAGAPAIELKFPAARRARLRLSLRFFLLLLRLAPAIAAARLRDDAAQRAKVKRVLKLDPRPGSGPIDRALFAPAKAAERETANEVLIVLPVHDAHDVLVECLNRVSAHTDLPWRMIAVEDGSTDPRVRPALRDWAQRQAPGQVELIEHARNRGFVTSVNEAFERILRTEGREPVILLNSDALVPPGWASRLVAPLAEHPAVASVTPMSNDAEIFTVPVICAPLPLRHGQAEDIDRRAAGLSAPAARAEAPTGVGFCMAMSRAWLDRVPAFDMAFGRGYGEEVDWCQKVRALGGRHMGTAQLFVEHRGGGSFGSAEKRRLVAQNGRVITRRYPHYDREVQDFIQADPLCGARLALALAWAAGAAPDTALPVYLAHSLGGGADRWLDARIAQDAEVGRPSLVLRVGGRVRWQLEVAGPAGRVIGWTDDLDLVRRLLDMPGSRRLVYSCGVGDPDPVALPDLLLDLQRPGDTIEVLFHDYFPVSPSYTLLDGRGRYHGPVTPALLRAQPDLAAAHAVRRPDGRPVELGEWQEAWGRLVHAADRITVFSPESGAIVTAVWPGLADRLDLSPHEVRAPDLTALPPTPAPTSAPRPPVLAVLGNIAPHKGATLVQGLARLGDQARGARMVLIGDIDPRFELPRSVPVHGQYAPEDIPLLIRHYGVTHWLIPSVWPETFSFTTHEALATGLPVLAFVIGAQGGAVTRAANGIPLAYDPDGDPVRTIVAALHPESVPA